MFIITQAAEIENGYWNLLTTDGVKIAGNVELGEIQAIIENAWTHPTCQTYRNGKPSTAR